MNNPQFVQQPCSKCGATVWISPAAGVGYCPSCHTPNQMRAQGAAPQAGAPMQGQAPQAPAAQPAANPAFAAAMSRPRKPPILPVVGAIALAIVGSVGWYAFKNFVNPTHAKVKDIGISDEKKADLDTLMSGTNALAKKKWRADAGLYEINIQSFKSDGTVDLTKSATLTYFSASRVKSTSLGGEDSVKDFVFNDADIEFAAKKGLDKTDPDFQGIDDLKCNGAKLGKVLKKHHLSEAHIQMNDDMRTDGDDNLVWHVMGDGDSFYVDADSDTCENVNVHF